MSTRLAFLYTSSNNGLHRRLWTGFIALTVLFVGFDAVRNIVYANRVQEALQHREILERAKAELIRKAGISESNEQYGIRRGYFVDLESPLQSISALISQFRQEPQRPRPLLRKEVQARLGGVFTDFDSPDPEMSWYRFTDSGGVRFVFAFDKQDRYMNMRLEASQFPPDPGYPLSYLTCPNLLETLRRHDLKICGLLFVLFIVLRSHRILLGELLLLASISSILIRWPPLGSAPVTAYLEASWLPWAIALTMFAFACLVWACCVREQRSRIRCAVCGYNLAGTAGGVCGECGTPLTPEIQELLRLKSALVKNAPSATRGKSGESGEIGTNPVDLQPVMSSAVPLIVSGPMDQRS